MAEGIFNDLIIKNGFQKDLICDSAGTADYHVGKLPDHRMRKTAQRHRINLTHVGRQLNCNDLVSFDYVLAMDKTNLENILSLRCSAKTPSRAKVMLMRDFDSTPGTGSVPDPYYGGQDGFEEVYQMLKRCNETFLAFLREEHFTQKWL
jgi:protein-tyrosine phosphatase